jgi:hypothetical protein
LGFKLAKGKDGKVQVKHLLIKTINEESKQKNGMLGKRRERQEWVSKEENKHIVMAQFDTQMQS